MAEDTEVNVGGSGGGSFFQRRFAGLPMWVWIIGGAAVIGGIWYLRRAKAASAAQSADAATAQNPTDNTIPYSIVPVDQGLSEQQYQDLLNQLKTLQGPPSTGTTPPAGVPARVTDLHFMSGTATKNSFALAWSPSQGATDYTVHVGPHTLTGAGSRTLTTNIPSIEVQGLAPGTTYWANVLAHNASGFAPGSNLLTNLKTLG